MKRPSFQFYTGDWTANPNLRRCTFAEKGIWLEVLCLLHDQQEYGLIRWPLREIAEAVKCRPVELQALERKQVLKGSDVALVESFVYVPRHAGKDGEPVVLLAPQPGPVWFSSRMVRDEYVRTTRGKGTRFGDESGMGIGEQPTREPKPPPTRREGAGASSSSSSSKKNKAPPRIATVDSETLLADGLDESVAAEWLAHRRTKKSPLTPRAWDLVKTEAGKAGWSLQDAVCRAMAKGWIGFEAEWVAKDPKPLLNGTPAWAT